MRGRERERKPFFAAKAATSKYPEILTQKRGFFARGGEPKREKKSGKRCRIKCEKERKVTISRLFLKKKVLLSFFRNFLPEEERPFFFLLSLSFSRNSVPSVRIWVCPLGHKSKASLLPFSLFSLSLLYTGWKSKPLLLVPLCVFAVCVPRLRFIGGRREEEKGIIHRITHTHRVGKKELLKHTRDLNSPKKFPCKKRTHCI